jgi:hypothetical protein
MSQVTNNQDRQVTNNQDCSLDKKAYHSPQLRNLGKVSDKTFTNLGGSVDDGLGIPIYSS